jgi:hypothetical protein
MGNSQCLEESFDIDMIIIEDYEDANVLTPRPMLDPDFESDVFEHMRDPNIEFPIGKSKD